MGMLHGTGQVPTWAMRPMPLPYRPEGPMPRPRASQAWLRSQDESDDGILGMLSW